jgi:hypothetical protein
MDSIKNPVATEYPEALSGYSAPYRFFMGTLRLLAYRLIVPLTCPASPVSSWLLTPFSS